MHSIVTIVIPAYNEKLSIRSIVERVKVADTLGLQKEIIIVDNCSTDGTREILQDLMKQDASLRVIFHSVNEGVGASWRDGIKAAHGTIVIRQDADLEYQPEDFPILLRPIVEGSAKIVYGSRLLQFEKSAYRYKTYLWGGIFLNKICNIILGTKLTDVLTASKTFDKTIFQKFDLESVHFEIEAELTAKATRAGFHIVEVPITYKARSFEEGKKIRWHHAFKILSSLVRYRFFASLKIHDAHNI